MTLNQGSTPPNERTFMFRSAKRTALYVGALGALALGGSAIASATTTTTTSTTSTTTTPTTTTPGTAPSITFGHGHCPGHGSAAHESAEKTVTGAIASKVQAAAVKIVGSGTAGPVTSDFMGNGYETTVTKADGTKVEIHLNSSLQQVGQGTGGWPMGGAQSGAPAQGAGYGQAPGGSYGV